MGYIETTYDLPSNLTTFKVVGKMSAADFFDCLARYYNGNVTLLNLWDLTESNLSEISTDEIEDFAEYARHLAEARKGGKTAIVFGGTFEFGLGRMFKTYLEIAGLPLAMNNYQNLEEAKKWLDFQGDQDCRY